MKRFALALALTLVAVAGIADDHPNDARGFAPDRVFDVHDVDHVNLFNGNLNIGIPIGPEFRVNAALSYQLHLVYNSHVWKFDADTGGAYPLPTFNAGLGWSLSLGRLVDGPDTGGDYAAYAFETPDGAQHSLYPADPGFTTPAYSRDSSFYRFNMSGSSATVDAPDGTTYVFSALDQRTGTWTASSTSGLYYLTSIRNHLANEVDLSYSTTSSWPEVWTVSDGERVVTAYFKSGATNHVLDHIDFPQVGGNGPSTYQFSTTVATVPYPIGDTSAENKSVSLLTSMTTPSAAGSSAAYAMTLSDGTPAYDTTTHTSPGVLTHVILPTGNSISWTYGQLTFPGSTVASARSPVVSKPVAVTKRSLYDGGGTLIGDWTYGRKFVSAESCTALCGSYGSNSPCTPTRQMTGYVIPPASASGVTATDVTYFSTYDSSNDICDNSAGWADAEYGAPITHYASSTDNSAHSTSGDQGFLSSEAFTSFDPTTVTFGRGGVTIASPATRVRSDYARYESDQTSGMEQNRRTSHSATFFDDVVAPNGCGSGSTVCFSATNFSVYDHYGHYQQTTTDGNFPGPNVRTSFTAYDAANGLDAAGDWLLNTWNEQCVAMEASARTTDLASCAGLAGAKDVQAQMDRGTGLLTAKRTQTGSNDVLTTFTYEATGDLKSQADYGGDVQSIAASGFTVPSQAPVYEVDYTNAFSAGGHLTSRKSRYVNPNDRSGIVTTADDDYDAYTGVVTASRDSAGLSTTYGYDARWRPTSVSPPAEAATTASYTDAVTSPSFQGATATVTRASTSAGTVKQTYEYDGNGRVVAQKVLMPDATTSVVRTTYDALGRKTFVSSQVSDSLANSPGTSFTNFDAFGNARTITAADGSQTTLARAGGRWAQRIVNVATTSGAQPAESDEFYDRFGRLATVTEGTNITASYGYDESDHLTSVSMTGPEGGTQTRTFTYDLRGFLTQEQHPEIGVGGNGTAVYTSFDPRGHARQNTIGGSIVRKFTYDGAERITDMSDGTGSSLRQFTFGTANIPSGCTTGTCDARTGKLTQAVRHNRNGDDISVTEQYAYAGAGGRMSERDTTVASTTTFTGDSFAMKQTFNDLGQLSSVTYPCRVASGVCSDTTKTVSYAYANGQLNGITSLPEPPPPGSVSQQWGSLTYHPNGMVDTVTHGSSSSAVTESIAVASDWMARPSSIAVNNVYGSELWSSGSYAYDGAGNISQIGMNAYAYDTLGRLVSSTENGLTNGFSYDSFGNRLSMQSTFCRQNFDGSSRCFTSSSAPYTIANPSAPTNHYTSQTYDAAGNVTSDGSRQFTYDVLGMPQEVTAGGRDFRYVYAAGDERVALIEHVTGSDAIVRNHTTWTLRGPGNQLLRVYDDDSTSGSRNVTWKEDELWRGASLLANDSPAGARHYSLDHLGSTRVITDANGNLLSTRTFAPFGGGGTSDGGALQFTGQERDSANVGTYVDLPDYFHARLYDVNGGRFLSVDPAKDWKPAEPQSWNMYTYVRNNPVRYTDKDGRVVTISTSGNSQALQDEIVETLTRPDGRAAFAGLANDTGFTMNMKDATITPQAVIQFQMNTRGSANITFGTSTPIISTAGGKTQVTGANVQVDTTRVSAFHPDKSGVTTNVHEMHHVNAMRSGGNPGAGDLPSSQTGPAEREGQRVAAQAPDMTKQQAQQFLQNLLASDAVKLVQ